MFIKDGKLFYVYNFLGIAAETHVRAADGSHAGTSTSSASSSPRNAIGEHQRAASARRKLYIDDKVVAEGPMRRP